jgi:uncharacterized protein
MMEGGIRYQTCRNCGARWYLGRELCPRCGSHELSTPRAAGRGTVFAVTTIHRAPDAAFADLVPYRIALIDLDEGVRIMAHLACDAPIGSVVAGGLETVAGREIPVFRPLPDDDGSPSAQ